MSFSVLVLAVASLVLAAVRDELDREIEEREQTWRDEAEEEDEQTRQH